MDQTAAAMPPDHIATADEQTLRSWYAALRAHVATHDALAPLAPMLAEREAWSREPDAALKLHLSVCRGAALDFSGRLEVALIAAIDSYLRQSLFLPSIGLRDPQTVSVARAHADEMDRRSHSLLSVLPEAKVVEMRKWFESKPALLGDQVGVGFPISVAQARQQANFARFPTTTVMACPHLMEIAADPLVLAAVERHLGVLPTVLGVAAWWSFADRAVAERTQLFHWDGAFDLRYCKLLIYLTDVDEAGSPHQIYEGTHGPAALSRLSRQRPTDGSAILHWYMRPEWKTDEETLRWFGHPPTVIAGSAGTRFLTSTRALHRAALPSCGDRLMCQVIYGVSPRRQVADIGCRPLSEVRGGTLPPALLDRPFGYINRLFLERG